jgi:hypothetical protein|tara:strand:- start:18 stop:431 length:414 start_codon:yes stop_codon:yes gene_type:complete
MKVGSGAVYDTETGVWYKSRSDAIQALGSELAIPALHQGKRLRIITMTDLISALGSAAEQDINNVSIDCTGVADLLLSSSRDPDGFYDCAATLAEFSKHLLEAREELLGHVNQLVYAEENKSQRISLNTDIAQLGLK